MQLNVAIVMAGLFKEQAEDIFSLTHEAQKLGKKLTHNFIHLSNKEALFHMGVQATGYEKVVSGYPDCVTAYYMMIQLEGEGKEAEKLDEAIDHLCKEAGEACLYTNSILFHHTLECQNKLSDFLTEHEDAIEALHDCIWTVVVKVMEDAGKPVANGLGITVHLVDILPTIPIHLAFHSSTPGLTRFEPEVYSTWPRFRTDVLDFSHMPPPQSDWKALDVLCQEILKNMGGASKMAKVVEEPAACFAVGGEEDAGHSEDEETLSQGTVSLLDISTSNNEDARKSTMCEAAHKSNVQYGNWQDEQICQGKEGITQCDKGVNDYADGGKPYKAPDKIGPLVPDMEECGMFKPLDTIVKPLGLCRFYCTNPPHSNIITNPKSAASAHKIKCLLEKAKDLGWPFTIIVFEGGNVTLLGLLQELYSRLTLLHIPIFTPDKAKLGQKTIISCCPICT